MSDSCQYLRKYRQPSKNLSVFWQPGSSNVNQSTDPPFNSIVLQMGFRRPKRPPNMRSVANRFPGLTNIQSICFLVCTCILYDIIIDQHTIKFVLF